MMGARNSSPSFAIGGVDQAFNCICCGAETFGIPPLDVRSLCCTCLGDHEEYEDGYCIMCGQERDDGPFEDDIGMLWAPEYRPGDPIGTPISAIDGNAMNARRNPAAWDNWVRISESWGYP